MEFAFYRVAWSVGLSVALSVCTLVSPAKTAEVFGVTVWVQDWGRLMEPSITWGPDPPWEGAIVKGLGRFEGNSRKHGPLERRYGALAVPCQVRTRLRTVPIA